MNVPSPQPDELDALLTDFFRSERPATWPKFQRPVRSTLAQRPTAALPQSRAVLAAAALALLSGVWFLSLWKPAPPRAEINLNDTTATRPGRPLIAPATQP